MARPDWTRLYTRLGPWISLVLGVVSTAFIPYGRSFAPVAAALVLLGWSGAAALARWLPHPPAPDAETSWIRRTRLLSLAAVANLYQSALFFLVPLWLRSATWSSINIGLPLLLAALAVFSCFEEPYRRAVLDRPWARTLVSALVLFAALVPALTVLVTLPPAAYVRWAALGAALVTGVAQAPRRRPVWRPLMLVGGLALATAALAPLLARWLPPVPVDAVAAGAGTAIEARELVGSAPRFGEGTLRVYARFAVEAPPGYAQPVRFQWWHEGTPRGEPLGAQIVGGRRGGFRTWAWQRHPAPGRWRADLLTEGGQLIGRVTFRVGPAR